VIIPDLMSMII